MHRKPSMQTTRTPPRALENRTCSACAARGNRATHAAPATPCSCGGRGDRALALSLSLGIGLGWMQAIKLRPG